MSSEDSEENFEEESDVSTVENHQKRKISEETEGSSAKNSKMDLSQKSSNTSTGTLNCEKFDNDCIVIPFVERPKAIIGFNLGKGLQEAEGYLPKQENPQPIKFALSDVLLATNFRNNFQKSWNENIDFKANNIELSHTPFKHCVIDNFTESYEFLNNLRLAYNDMEWHKRKLDLYEFFQSIDLKNCKNEYMKTFYETFKKDIHKWMSELTGIKIEKISLTASVYTYTDYLLLHDDLQRDRAIAFIFYLSDVKPKSNDNLWTPEMGGSLQLYDKDSEGKPNSCVHKIFPKNNRFVFFKVTDETFHQVEEVFTMDHCRFSINGWFHTKDPNPYLVKGEKVHHSIPRNIFKESFVTNLQLQHWIQGDYLSTSVRTQIQQHIEQDSEISLTNYFIKEKYEDLYQALQSDDLVWEKVGPLNRNNFEIINDENVPLIIRNFLDLFRSKKFFKLLRDYTHLDLAEIEEKNYIKKPTVRIELQRWKPGCFSLMSDQEDPHLDVIFYIGCEKTIVGGETMYVANDADVEQALVSVQPIDNCLDIIYCDTNKFTRYISHTSQNKCFYTLVCSYKEFEE